MVLNGGAWKQRKGEGGRGGGKGLVDSGLHAVVIDTPVRATRHVALWLSAQTARAVPERGLRIVWA